ncbi:MAG: HEAT repeat domain-containing protein, partial [Candidatus Omnitrophica bacterium]|nr:HEAT repeat domain-containing protein [Candidatus Omnitrophota bacterium]
GQYNKPVLTLITIALTSASCLVTQPEEPKATEGAPDAGETHIVKLSAEAKIERALTFIVSDEIADRVYACGLLAQVGPEAEHVLPELEKALKDSHWRVKVRAAVAISKIRPIITEEAIFTLIDLLRDEQLDMAIRRGTAFSLADIDTSNASVQSKAILESIVEDDNEDNIMRIHIAKSLGYNSIDEALLLSIIDLLRRNGYRSYLALSRLDELAKEDQRASVKDAAKTTAEAIREDTRLQLEEEKKRLNRSPKTNQRPPASPKKAPDYSIYRRVKSAA